MSKPMSKFFAPDDDEEESVKSQSIDEQPEEQAPAGSSAFFKKFHLEDSDDEEPVKRVVKSSRDKRFEEMEECIERIHSKMKINDWNAICDEFEKLNKSFAKLKQIVAKEGVPRLYIRALVELEDFLKRTNDDAEAKAKLSKINNKGFNTMKQRLKKNNAQFAADIEKYRQAPDQTAPSPEPEEDDAEAAQETKAPAPAKEQVRDEEEEEEDIFAQPKPKGDSDEEEEDEPALGGDRDEAVPASRWFRADTGAKVRDEEDEEGFMVAGRKGKAKGKKEKEKAAPAPAKVLIPEAAPATPAAADTAPTPLPTAPAALPEAEQKPIVWTDDLFDKKLAEIAANRGKKGTVVMDQIAQLEALLPHATTPARVIDALIHLISAQFDTGASPSTPCMPTAMWRSCQQNIVRVVATFNDNYPAIQLRESDETDAPETTPPPDEPGVRRIQVGLYPFLLRLDSEFLRSLQITDPHTQDYLARLQDEPLLLDVCERVQAYYARLGMARLLARTAALRMEHLYYKTTLPQPTLLASLASPVYRWGDERLRSRATLWQVYNLALTDHYYEARDMLLMSRLAETVPALAQQQSTALSEPDIALQILYNRTLVQLGMAAFRAGLIPEAHNALAELCYSSRLRELLAQGVTRYADRTPEQERAERRRMLPFHMHINLDLVELVHLVAAVLLEVPNLAAQPLPDSRKKYVSKVLRRRFDDADRQIFAGPPENTRDCVVAAARALLDGDWKGATELLLAVPAWAMIAHPEQVKAMVARKVQEEGLRTYLLQASAFYDGLGLNQLAAMFEMSPARVHAIASKLMFTDEIHAAWDSASETILFQRAEPSRLQQLSLQLADKATVLTENNERLLEAKLGGGRGDREKGTRDKGLHRAGLTFWFDLFS